MKLQNPYVREYYQKSYPAFTSVRKFEVFESVIDFIQTNPVKHVNSKGIAEFMGYSGVFVGGLVIHSGITRNNELMASIGALTATVGGGVFILKKLVTAKINYENAKKLIPEFITYLKSKNITETENVRAAVKEFSKKSRSILARLFPRGLYKAANLPKQ